MDGTFLDTNSPGIHTVRRMSLAVMAAALMPAQESGLDLRKCPTAPWQV